MFTVLIQIDQLLAIIIVIHPPASSHCNEKEIIIYGLSLNIHSRKETNVYIFSPRMLWNKEL